MKEVSGMGGKQNISVGFLAHVGASRGAPHH